MTLESNDEEEVPLTGYTDRLSVRPGEKVNFYLSASRKLLQQTNAHLHSNTSTDVDAMLPTINVQTFLKRSISADPNPKGVGIVELDASTWWKPTISREIDKDDSQDENKQPPSTSTFANRRPSPAAPSPSPSPSPTATVFEITNQPIPSRGSYARTLGDICVPNEELNRRLKHVSVDIWVYPTVVTNDPNSSSNIWSWGSNCDKMNGSFALDILANRQLSVSVPNIKTSSIVTSHSRLKVKRWNWIRVTLTVEGSLTISRCTLDQQNRNQRQYEDEVFHIPQNQPDDKISSTMIDCIQHMTIGGPFCLARNGSFNGKLEQPTIRVLYDDCVIGDQRQDREEEILASWDFTTLTTTQREEHQSSNLWSVPCTGLVVSRQESESNKSVNGAYDLVLYNHPTRGVKGHLWDATEFCWYNASAKQKRHYGAIHFHDDDIYDFQWNPTFEWVIPPDTPSGIYIVRVVARNEQDGPNYEEALPLFVCPPPSSSPSHTRTENSSKTSKKVAVLIPTFTYVVYGNHARPDFDEGRWKERVRSSPGSYPYNPSMYPLYGWSTYNAHSDNSGIHFASHHRPLFNLRPGYITFSHDFGFYDGDRDKNDTDDISASTRVSHCSGLRVSHCSGLRHFPADSHLISWLHHEGIEYDILTDHLLHSHGVTALADYRTVMTCSHPEYHTPQSLNALQQFRDNIGGNLIYLGGNGFYWKIAAAPPANTNHCWNDGDDCKKHDNQDVHLLEIRRCEGGVRTWASEPGEYYNCLDGGSYGGLWRNNGRPPSSLVGIGFASQGNFLSRPYLRTEWHHECTKWIFDGIEPQDTKVIGNFGFSGNGAAGYELDRVDPLDGHNDETSEDYESFVIVAQSRPESDERFILVPEEVLTPWTNTAGLTNDDAKRSDMIYFRLKPPTRDGRQPVADEDAQNKDQDSLIVHSGGSQVFSVGSITFCGCLPYNNFENQVSQILRNIVAHFMA